MLQTRGMDAWPCVLDSSPALEPRLSGGSADLSWRCSPEEQAVSLVIHYSLVLEVRFLVLRWFALDLEARPCDWRHDSGQRLSALWLVLLGLVRGRVKPMGADR